MTTLKGIKGDQIRYLDQDPVVTGIPSGTWASGGSLNTGRGLMGNGMGTQTAGAVVAGFNPPNTFYANTELYNGSSWTESGDLPSGRYVGMAAGTQTAGLYAGGYGPSGFPAFGDTYYFNGTSWSDQSSTLNTPRDALRGTGVQTAAIAAGGISGPGTPADDETEIWNGSTWTEVNNLNTARYSLNIAGTSTDAIAGPGTQPPGYVAVVESWNGTSWSETTEINTARNNYGRTNYAAGGASTGALIFGGQSQPTGSPDSMTQTEYWNGTSWTELNDLGTGRGRLAGAGSTTAALAVGAYPNTNNSATEEWNTAPVYSLELQEGMLWFNSTSQTLKGYGAPVANGAWASGGNLPTAFENNAGAGYQTAALTFGGSSAPSPTGLATSYSYDGSAWSPTSSLNTGRRYLMGGGTQTAALAVGGIAASQTGATELWNGSTWTSNPTGLTRGSSTYDAGQSGTQTAAIVYGGEPVTAATESWNGSVWTAVSSLNTARWSVTGAGTQTAAIAFGGDPLVSATELYNGTSWTTATGTLNTGRGGLESAINGTQTAALAMGGATPPGAAGNYTEFYDGTSWTTASTLATSRVRAAGAGTMVSALIAGGANPSPGITATEEWTTTAAVVTVTTS